MGNRAVITTPDKKMGVYLHWNGGRDSVEAFLHYCELHGFRSPDRDPYGWARLCQVIGNFFGGGLSVGVGLYDQLDTDNWDNGVYIIEGWRIVGREFNRYAEQDSYDHMDMLHDIDDSQPEGMRLGRYIDAVDDVREAGMAMGKRRERWMTRDRAYSLLSFHPTEAFLDKYIRQRRGWKTVKPADIIIEKRDGAYWIRKDFGNRDFFAVSFPPER